jgi:hypothetical protein
MGSGRMSGTLQKEKNKLIEKEMDNQEIELTEEISKMKKRQNQLMVLSGIDNTNYLNW